MKLHDLINHFIIKIAILNNLFKSYSKPGFYNMVVLYGVSIRWCEIERNNNKCLNHHNPDCYALLMLFLHHTMLTDGSDPLLLLQGAFAGKIEGGLIGFNLLVYGIVTKMCFLPPSSSHVLMETTSLSSTISVGL